MTDPDHLATHRDWAAARRERNAKAGRCINETYASTHGKATHGVCCLRCRLIHKHGSEVARTLKEWEAFRPVR